MRQTTISTFIFSAFLTKSFEPPLEVVRHRSAAPASWRRRFTGPMNFGEYFPNKPIERIQQHDSSWVIAIAALAWYRFDHQRISWITIDGAMRGAAYHQTRRTTRLIIRPPRSRRKSTRCHCGELVAAHTRDSVNTLRALSSIQARFQAGRALKLS
jgi:hypothetical protein